jgi:phosphoglycerate dehydrogenase-like enzyme
MINWINSGGSYEYTANMDKTIVGIIGMGDMGKMYARRISDAGWR